MAIEQVLKDLGAATAYAYAVEKGYTGTEAEFAELMASYASVAQSAAASATAAAGSATSAASSASTASAAATTATTKASEASTSATNAAGSASSAASSATAASGSATSAAASATTASGKASEAATAATTATTAKTDAVAAKTAAETAQTAAETAQGKAETAQGAAEDAAESVSASAAQIATNTSDISDLKEGLTATAQKDDMLKAFPTDTASGSVASFADGANVPVKSLIVNIDPVQSGSGDPSPTNIRPISGWSEVNVNACGVNIWDEQWESGLISVSNGQNIAGSGIRSKNYSPCTPLTEYRFVFGSGTTKYVFWYDADHNYISNNAVTDIIVRFTSPPNAKYFKLRADTIATYNNDFSVNYPSTDTDYHPYSGQSINIVLGQTVYGGKLDVVSGVLTVDKKIIDGGTVQWNRFADGKFYSATITDAKAGLLAYGYDLVICSIYRTVSIASLASMPNCSISMDNGKHIQIRDDRFTDEPSFETAMSGVQFVYDLETPLTIQLTAHEVATLLGSNNIWADCGDTAVEYRADPTLYIQRLTEPDADMVADANITSGQYFMVGNTLYKATANIASGASIVPNVNCTRKSLSEALNEINA